MIRLNRIQRLISHEKVSAKKILKPELKQSKCLCKKVYEKYLHSYETRSQEEINDTNGKIYNLTQLNLERLNNINYEHYKSNSQKFSNCVFIYLSGVPSFPNELKFLNLPGKFYQVISHGFQLEKDDEYREENLYSCKFSKNAQRIHNIIQENSGKDIIFLYHSFGTYNMSVYFDKYGTQRVKGLIQIGAAPVRQYQYITEVINHTLGSSEWDIKQNKDEVAGQRMNALMMRMNKQLNVEWNNTFPSISFSKSFLHYFKSSECPVLFDLNRRYPNILKLMIFGQNDNLFQKDLICERAHFYSKQKLHGHNELKKKFSQMYGNEPQNIQQHFIYMIPKGKHSVHLQKKNQPTISKAVRQYLDLILD